MAGLNRIEVTSKNQLKESATWVCSVTQAGTVGILCISLLQIDALTYVLLMYTHKTYGHCEIFDGIIECLTIC